MLFLSKGNSSQSRKEFNSRKPGRATTQATALTSGPVGKEKGPALRDLVFRAPGGTRTPNLLIRSQMLYPLSYGRTVAGAT